MDFLLPVWELVKANWVEILLGLGALKLGTAWALLPAIAGDVKAWKQQSADGNITQAEKADRYDRVMARIETLTKVLQGITPFKTKV